MRQVAVLFVLAVTLAACATARETNMAEGAGVGAVGGAVVAGPPGAVVGGAAGAVVADTIVRPRHRHTVCHWSQALQKRVCHYRYY